MRDTFNAFLNKFLGQGFLHYPGELLPDAWAAFESASQLFLSDVAAKHPGYDGGLGPELFSLMLADPSMEGVFYYRVERALFLKDEEHPLLPFLAALMRTRVGMELYYSTEIGPGLNVQHGSGIVVGPRCRIGSSFMIHQGATLGQSRLNSPEQRIVIGDNVVLYAGVKVVGTVTIGDDVQVGANAVVTRDLASGANYVGAPARPVGGPAQANREG